MYPYLFGKHYCVQRFVDVRDENNLQDHDDDIIFEDFARLRLKGGETDAWKKVQAMAMQPARPFQPIRTDVYISCD